MLIFSLGRVLQGAVKNTDLEGGNLEAVLESMVHPNPAVRASLMDLFDVSTAVTPLRTDVVLMFVMRAENLAVWFVFTILCHVLSSWPVGARFSAPVQTGPEAHPVSYTMGTGSFLRVKRPWRGVDHPLHLVSRLMKQYSYTSTPPLGFRVLF
jgi:hypothetical protein